jgi:tRNA/rRNA methyltransferase
VEQLPGIIIAKEQTIETVAIVFGREESGLSNEELSLCHLFSNIPMVATYPSLNLSQAVMVYCTYLSKINFSHTREEGIVPPVSELQIVRQKAKQILDDVGILPSNNIYGRIMERLMMLDKDDTNLFHSFAKYYLMKYHDRKK